MSESLAELLEQAKLWTNMFESGAEGQREANDEPRKVIAAIKSRGPKASPADRQKLAQIGASFKQGLAEVRENMGEKVYSTVIPRNVRISEAPSHGVPALVYDLRCPGSQAYIKLAGELIQREKIRVAA